MIPPILTGRRRLPQAPWARLLAGLLPGLLLTGLLLVAPLQPGLRQAGGNAMAVAMAATSPDATPDATPSATGPAAIVEVLRVRVPADQRQAWLEAEAASWGPWLEQQRGFWGRDLFWDPASEEGVLLIRWRQPDDWFSIPSAELDTVQARFEAIARQATGRSSGNPFPLVAEGKWMPEQLPPPAAA